MASSTPPTDGPAPADETREDAPAKPRRKPLTPRTKLILLAIALVAAVAIAIWATYYFTYGRYFQSTDDAQIQADATVIAPRVNGYVTGVLVQDNQDVAKGQPLVAIDPRDYRAKAAQADAQIAEAQASADQARAGAAEQQAMIAQSQAQLAAAQADAAHDAGEVARYTPLVASGAETREQLARLRSTATQSAEKVRAQSAALEAQQRHLATFAAQIAQANAQAKAGKATLASADVDLGATTINAPIAGRVGDRTVTPGAYVAAGTKLLSVVPLDAIYIVANFKETQLALMRPGQRARIEVDALGGLDVDGEVESVSPGTGEQFSILPPQNATGNFTKITQRVPVRLKILATPQARRLLVPGLSVTVTVDTRNAKGDLKQIEQDQHRYDQQQAH